MSKLLIGITLIMVLLGNLGVTAQEYPMLHYTKENGLPSNTIYQVFRDSKGFVWIATDKGLTKYNGISFDNFTMYDGLPDNEIFLLKEDFEHRIWLGAYNGQMCYYKDNQFHTSRNTPFLMSIPVIPYISDITIEEDSSITFNFADHNRILNIKGEKKHVLDMSKLAHSQFSHFFRYTIEYTRYISPNRYQLIGHDTALLIDSNCNVLEVKKYCDNDEQTRLSTIQDQHYFFNKNGLFNMQLQRIYTSNIPANTIHSYFLTKGYKFIATMNGLVVNDDLVLLKNYNISSINTDFYGNYWISTLDNGIYILSKDFSDMYQINEAYEGQVNYTFVSPDGIYYCPVDNDLFLLKKNNIKLIVNNRFKEWQHEQLGYTVYNNNFYTFTPNEVAMVSNLRSKQIFKRWTYPLGYEHIKESIYNKGSFYLRASRYIFYLPQSAFNGSELPVKQVTKTTDYAKRIYSMSLSPKQDIWFSTSDEIYKIIENVPVIQSQFNQIGFKNFIFIDSYLVGISLKNELVICKYPESKPSYDFRNESKCVWNKVYKLDSVHALISTNNLYKLFSIEQKTKSVSVHTIENKYIPMDCDDICSDNSNTFFFKNGKIVTIKNDVLFKQQDKPLIYFSDIRTNDNQLIRPDSLVVVDYERSRNLLLTFTPITNSMQNIKYFYAITRALRDSDNWKITKQNAINLINPEYGSYSIKIMAQTANGVNSEITSFSLIIEKPYWATWWFRAFIAALIIAIIVISVRYRIKLLNKKNETERQREVRLLKSEYKALNALMNPHFIFNTLNNVQSLVNKDEKRAANEYLRIFANMIRQNMHNISLETISLQNEMDLVANYLKLEKLRFKDHLNYEINIEDDIDLSEIMVPPLLIQPLVENSIKHGLFPKKSADNKLIINIFQTSGSLTIEVRDNGIGMAAAKLKSSPEHTSFGMDNLYKRIEQVSLILNKKITLTVSEQLQDATSWTVVSINIEL